MSYVRFQFNITKAKFYASLLKLISCDITTAIFVKVRESSKQILLSLHLIQMRCCSNAIFVKVGECRKKILLSLHLIQMQCCSNEFTLVNRATVVKVSLQKHISPRHFATYFRGTKLLDYCSYSRFRITVSCKKVDSINST